MEWIEENRYLILKYSRTGLKWEQAFTSNDLSTALRVFNQRRTDEPKSDFLLVMALESTVVQIAEAASPSR